MKKITPTLLLFTLPILLISCSSEDTFEEIKTTQTTETIETTETTETNETTETTNNVIWKNWYLSVPIDRGDGSGKSTSIYYKDIEGNNLTTEQKEYFHKNSNESYTFYTKFTGFTTSGGYDLGKGKYCRTELREYWQGNQNTSDNWSMGTGMHEMESVLQVNSCGGSYRTYVAQIHGISSTTASGSPATVKVQWNKGDIIIEYYVKPDNGASWTSTFDEKINIGKVDNEKFTIKLRVQDGKLNYALYCEAKNIDLEYQPLYDYVGNGYEFDNYFKTGNYFKWNSDFTESAEVILYSVKTVHN